MKVRNLSLFLVIALLVSVCAVQAADRLVVIEAFTQWNCGPCAGWNPTEYSVVGAMTRDTVVTIKYHVSWPSPNNDAFHLWNVSESSARVSYYGVSGVPDGFVDGRTNITRNANTFRNQIRSRAVIAAPCEIELEATIAGPTSVQFSGTISATDSALVNTRLYVALITDRVTYTSPPGSNGETEFRDIFRDMWPNTSGETINVALGGTYNFSGTLNKDASWPNDGMSIVCWIQDYSSKWVHQAGWAPVLNEWAVATSTESERQLMIDVADVASYYVQLTNFGSNDDVYTVSLADNLPAGWTQTIEATGINPDPNSIQVPLASGESTWLLMNVRPNNNGGNANLAIAVQSNNNTATSAEEAFRLMAGLDIVIVDDDGGSLWGDYESYYIDALNAVAGNRIVGWWDLEQGSLDDLDLNVVEMVVWFTGSSPNNGTLDIWEQSTLEMYLMFGGKLFLSGQGIAFDLRTSSFMDEYLHTDHVQPYAQGQSVVGIDGNPVSNGLSFSIDGPGGAQNQIRQSSIAPSDEFASVMFDYTGGVHHAGLGVETDSYRAIFLGFGFEAITDANTRNTIMQRAIDWLIGPDATEPTAVSTLPAEFALGQNYPNPFNPETTIPYMIPARAEVSLRVFDVLGREVAVLAAGTREAGTYFAHWNAANAASGLYFYRLDANSGTNEFHATKKLMLLK